MTEKALHPYDRLIEAIARHEGKTLDEKKTELLARVIEGNSGVQKFVKGRWF